MFSSTVVRHPVFIVNVTTFIAACCLAIFAGNVRADESAWLDEMSLLREQSVKSVAVVADQISAAPSAVSVVTSDDIRDYGYSSLSDILDSMRGVFTSRDWMYGYLSGRGYGNSGPGGGYAGRITLLIDGYRAPENYFGQSFLGNDSLIDISLIDRVEYIPGSGSSSYGDGAFLGVVNIITKDIRNLVGARVINSIGSDKAIQSNLVIGSRLDSGLDMALSMSAMRSDGRRIPTEVSGLENSSTENDSNRRLYLKAKYGDWSLASAHVERKRPDNLNHTYDLNTYGRMKFDGEVVPGKRVSVDLYTGRYRYRESQGEFLFENADVGGDWWGMDAKLISTLFENHLIVVGAEYRDDYSQQFFTKNVNKRTSRKTASLYFYDDIALNSSFRLSVGVRADDRKDRQLTLSPRAALIYSPSKASSFRLSMGRANRQPLADDELIWLKNPMVEKLSSREFVWEQELGKETRLLSSVYKYSIDNTIYAMESIFDADLKYVGNAVGFYDRTYAKGFEVELRHSSRSGLRAGISYSYQDTGFANGMLLANSPKQIGKFNISFPIFDAPIRLGLNGRYLGKRFNHLGSFEQSVLIGDLTLTGKWNSWSYSFSLRNIGNVKWNQVSGAYGASGIYPSRPLNWWAQLEYTFK
jgi:outer membrane cobalamin receptor